MEKLWPGLLLVNGRPRHPQSQGSVEKSNGSMKDSLIAWMRDNGTSNWSRGLSFVQWALNTTCSEATKVVPYKVIFGVKPKIGLASNIPIELLKNIHPGIHEEDFLNMMGRMDEQDQNDTVRNDLEIIPPINCSV